MLTETKSTWLFTDDWHSLVLTTVALSSSSTWCSSSWAGLDSVRLNYNPWLKGTLQLSGKKIAKFRWSCDSFCVHKLQETTFICNIAIHNLGLHYCMWQLFYVSQLSTFLCIILIANVFIEYWNWDLLYERLHLRTFVCIIATFDWQCLYVLSQ